MKEKKQRNLVAKFAHQFNRAKVEPDKTRYSRKVKHKVLDTSIMTLIKVIAEVSSASLSNLLHDDGPHTISARVRWHLQNRHVHRHSLWLSSKFNPA